jgi:hypothetical protein
VHIYRSSNLRRVSRNLQGRGNVIKRVAKVAKEQKRTAKFRAIAK